MKQAFDSTSVRLTLRQGIAKGYWTIEQLDRPSPSWEENSRHFRLHYPNYQQRQYRNLLRCDEDLPEVEELQHLSPGYDPNADYPF